MFQIEMAGLVIRIGNRFEAIRRQCRDYLTDLDRPADIAVSVSDEDLQLGKKIAPKLYMDEGDGEFTAAYIKINDTLPAFDAFIMHASAVGVNDGAYCFVAKSGVGKSTHTRYWKETLGDRLTVINGDKPVFRFREDQLRVYGTPWCGKENWQANLSMPVKAICLLERGTENAVFPADASEVPLEILRHLHLSFNGELDMPKLFSLIDRMLTSIPVYRLRCRNDRSAAETAISFFGL